jgi:general secretion pathway protein M
MANQEHEMKLSGLVKLTGLSFSEFWARRDTRERAMLTAAAVVMIFALTYALLIAPALAGRKQLNRDLPLMRQQVAQMQAWSKQAEALSGKPVTPVAAMNRDIIETSLARNNLKLKSLQLNGGFAKVQIGAVPFSGTLSWLEEMQKSSRISVVDASITALDQPDMVDATFTLLQAGNE